MATGYRNRPGYVLVALVKRVRNPKTGKVQIAPPGSAIPIWRKITTAEAQLALAAGVIGN